MDPKKIKELRQRFGWSQERLARELGKSFQTINRWERGRARPTPKALQTLMKLDSLSKELSKSKAFRLEIKYPIGIRLRKPGCTTLTQLSATSENISSTGLMFKTTQDIHEGDWLNVEWDFGEDKHFEVLSKVIWADRHDHEHSVGVRFDCPRPDVVSTVLDAMILH